jgi:transposase InsO family protein
MYTRTKFSTGENNCLIKPILCSAVDWTARRKVDKAHKLPVIRQCVALNISRSSAYRNAAGVSAEDIDLMRKGFLYLVAIMDWHSKKVLSWRLSNSLDAAPCVEALEEALTNYGTPEIFNSDQGCQYTSENFTDVLKDNGINISMDGKGRWMDNVFIERLWRSLKYEEVYLKAYDSVAQAMQGIDDWLMFYNEERRHSSLSRMTPDQVYYDLPSGLPIAA